MNSYKRYDKYARDKKRDKFYHSTAWKKARELALIRDHYLCQVCLKQKKIKNAEMVHHIVEVKDDFDKALELGNLQSLCNSCHNTMHGNNKNTKSKTLKVMEFKPNRNIF